MKKYLLISCVALVLFTSCSSDEAPAELPEVTITPPVDNTFELMVSGLSVPWGIEVIGEEEFIFTDRHGSLHHYENGEVSEVPNIPPSRLVTSGGLVYGGLMDVSLHPNYASNKLVYIAYVDFNYDLSVARFKLENNRAVNLEVIFESDQFSIGSRIAWQNDNTFFLSLGVGGSPYPDPGPQDINNDVGKIHRLRDDGQIPADNPVFPGEFGPGSVWTYGHRNPQGLFYEASTQNLYANEHGPLGGDELNMIIRGGNYGWPIFSYGLNYDNSPVSNMTEAEAALITVLPLKAWPPSFRVAPSGLIKLSDSNFTEWNGSFLMGALYSQNLLRYNAATDETEIVRSNIGRVRDIAQLPSGDLLVLIDAKSPNFPDHGRIVKLKPPE